MACIVTVYLFDVHVLVCIVLNDIETAIDRGIKNQCELWKWQWDIAIFNLKIISKLN